MIYEQAKLADAKKFDDAFDKESFNINELYRSSTGMIGTPVLFLASEGAFDAVEILLARGAFLDLAVFGAALGGYQDEVWRYVNEKGASVLSAASGAAQGGHFDLLKNLEAHVGNNLLNKHEIVHYLAIGGHREVVFSFLKENDEYLQSAANGAACGGQFELLSELETYTSTSFNSSEVLFYLAKGGHEDSVWRYINEKSALVQKAAQGAAIAGHYELLKKLEVFAGDSLDLSDIACQLASGGHESAVMHYIMEKGACAKLAALGAASRGQFQLLNKLENNANFSINLLDIVYQLSINDQDDAVLRYIKEKGFSAEQAALFVAQHGKIELLRKIEALEGVSLSSMEMIYHFALKNHEEAALCYAKEKGIPLRRVAECVLQTGQLEFFKKLDSQEGVSLSALEIIDILNRAGRDEMVHLFIKEERFSAQFAAEFAAINGRFELLSKMEAHYGDILNHSDIAFQLASLGYEEEVLRYIKEKGACAQWAVEGALAGGYLDLSSRLETLADMSRVTALGRVRKPNIPFNQKQISEDQIETARKLREEIVAEEDIIENRRQSKPKPVKSSQGKSREQDPWEKYWKKLVQLDSVNLSDDFVARYAALQGEVRDKNANHRFFVTPRKTEGFVEPLTPLFLVVYHYFKLAIAGNPNTAKMREKLLVDLSRMIEAADKPSCYGMVNVNKTSLGVKQNYSVLFLLLDMITFHHHKIASSVKKHTLRMLELMPGVVWRQQLFEPGTAGVPLDSPLRMITALFRSNAHSADFATAAIHIAVARAPLDAWIECPSVNASSGWICSSLAILLDALCNRIMGAKQESVDMSRALLKTLMKRGILDSKNSAIMALTFAYRDESSEVVQGCSVQQMLVDIDDMLNQLTIAPSLVL